eukprot:scaffold107240_cov49-Phaeocystis_antarctica.AAC.2
MKVFQPEAVRSGWSTWAVSAPSRLCYLLPEPAQYCISKFELRELPGTKVAARHKSTKVALRFSFYNVWHISQSKDTRTIWYFYGFTRNKVHNNRGTTAHGAGGNDECAPMGAFTAS